MGVQDWLASLLVKMPLRAVVVRLTGSYIVDILYALFIDHSQFWYVKPCFDSVYCGFMQTMMKIFVVVSDQQKGNVMIVWQYNSIIAV